MPAGRPLQYETPEEMQKLIDLYFLACKFNKTGTESLLNTISPEDQEIVKTIDDEVPTVCGLAYVLDLSRKALIEYQGREEFSNTIKKAKLRIERNLEQRLDGANAVGTIFNLKNNFGWKDKQELEHSGKMEYTDITEEELDKKLRYLESLKEQTESD